MELEKQSIGMLQTETKKWYAIYTRSRFEKKVEEELKSKGIETFLPLVKTIRKWSDRKKIVREAMFKGYVFVNINLTKERFDVLSCLGAVRFIYFNGRATEISKYDLNWIRILSAGENKLNETQVVSGKNFKPDEKVKIIDGVLKGMIGTVSQVSKKVVQIYFESIQQSLYLEIQPELLEKI